MNESQIFVFYAQVFFYTVVPFLVYFLAVYIRKEVFPSESAPPLNHQFLIAIPANLVVIAPLLATIVPAINGMPDGTFEEMMHKLSGYLVNLGVIMEHGLFMNEKVAEYFNKNPATPPAP